MGETDHIWPWAHLLCSSRFWFLFSFPIWADDVGHPFHSKTSLCPTTYICATLQVMSSLLVGSRDCFEHVSLIFTLFASRVCFVTLCFGELMFSLMWCRVCLLSLCVLVNSVSHLWGDYFVVHIYILQMFTFTHMHCDRQWWSNRILHTSFYEWLNCFEILLSLSPGFKLTIHLYPFPLSPFRLWCPCHTGIFIFAIQGNPFTVL